MERENRNREDKSRVFFDETVDLVKLQFTDVFGREKMVEMTRNQAERAMRDGYVINRFSLGGLKKDIADGIPDTELLKDREDSTELSLRPEPDTCRILPWESGQENVARVICGVYGRDGEPFWGDTRNVLKETLEKAGELGLQIDFDFQCEFYLFHTDDEGRPTTITHEVASYYDAGPIDLAWNVRRDMILSLEQAGMEVESTHHGLTPGQHSFLLPARSGVEAGDYLLTFKSAVKRIAKCHGLHATFMPKPNMKGDGSGLHVGVFVRNAEGKADRETAGYFRAGILKHLREMMIFTNPTVNSYKRLAAERRPVLQPEFPATAWEEGDDKAVRLVEGQDGSWGIQVLFPDPSANPYLALSAILAAGLDGVKNHLEPPAREGKLKFPHTLGVVLREMKDNAFARETFGEKLCRLYLEGKKEEWEQFCAYVTDWELDEYLYRC